MVWPISSDEWPRKTSEVQSGFNNSEDTGGNWRGFFFPSNLCSVQYFSYPSSHTNHSSDFPHSTPSNLTSSVPFPEVISLCSSLHLWKMIYQVLWESPIIQSETRQVLIKCLTFLLPRSVHSLWRVPVLLSVSTQEHTSIFRLCYCSVYKHGWWLLLRQNHTCSTK